MPERIFVNARCSSAREGDYVKWTIVYISEREWLYVRGLDNICRNA